MRSIALAAFLVLALLAPPASACSGASDPEVDTCDLAHTGASAPAEAGPCRYVDNDVCQPNCIISVRVYTEDNGEQGLQRHDDIKDDTCGGLREGDANHI